MSLTKEREAEIRASGYCSYTCAPKVSELLEALDEERKAHAATQRSLDHFSIDTRGEAYIAGLKLDLISAKEELTRLRDQSKLLVEALESITDYLFAQDHTTYAKRGESALESYRKELR